MQLVFGINFFNYKYNGDCFGRLVRNDLTIPSEEATIRACSHRKNFPPSMEIKNPAQFLRVFDWNTTVIRGLILWKNKNKKIRDNREAAVGVSTLYKFSWMPKLNRPPISPNPNKAFSKAEYKWTVL